MRLCWCVCKRERGRERECECACVCVFFYVVFLVRMCAIKLLAGHDACVMTRHGTVNIQTHKYFQVITCVPRRNAPWHVSDVCYD